MLRRRLLYEKTENSDSVNNLLDVVFYDTEENTILCVSKDDIDDVADNCKPIGIVIIPQSHDVYGDGSSCIMALKPIHLQTSSSGYVGSNSTYGLVEFGGYKGAYDLGIVPILNTTNMTITTGATNKSLTYFTNLPFIVSNNEVTEVKNEAFFATNHAFNKFGPSEHNKFVEAADKISEEWKTVPDSSFNSHVSSNNLTFYAGPLCAHRYMTVANYDVGEWYYPDNGEILYMWCNAYEIAQIMNKLNSKYGNAFCMAGLHGQTFTPFLYNEQRGYYMYAFSTPTSPNPNNFMVGHSIQYSPIGMPVATFNVNTSKVGRAYPVMKMQF